MSHYKVAPAAEQDMMNIGSFIRQRNARAAERLIAAFYRGFEILRDHPRNGHRRTDLTDLDVLFWTIKNRYLIVYRLRDGGVEIARIIDASRDVAALL